MFGTIEIEALVAKADATPPLLIERDTPIDGNVAPYELDVIAALVRANSPKVIFEIGTFDGRTSLNMAANAPARSTVYTLDLPAEGLSSTALALELADHKYVKKPRSGDRFADAVTRFNIVQLFGDSATFDFSPYYGKVDFMFIDGSHAYDYAKNDTAAALKMVREGGIIIWHDYCHKGFTPWPGVPRALKEFYLTDGRFGRLVQILGTSIAYLKVPLSGTYDFSPTLLGDSSRPEHLTGTLFVTPSIQLPADFTPIPVDIAARNTGAAVWLPSDAAIGPVRVGARVLSIAGEVIDESYWRVDLPFRRATFPGEMVEFEAEVPWPGPERIIEFDLVADGVAWFNLPKRPRIMIGAESSIATLRAEIEVLKARLDAVAKTNSWRITAPLRALRRG